MKKCFKCGQAKELDCFYKHGQMGDGHFNKCIECAKRDANDHRLKNLERIRAYDRERGKLPHRLKLCRKISIKFRKEYPEKYHAHSLLNSAIKSKKIVRPKTCNDCGRKTKIFGHHEDYYKPLDVVWVCQICHNKRHKELKCLVS